MLFNAVVAIFAEIPSFIYRSSTDSTQYSHLNSHGFFLWCRPYQELGLLGQSRIYYMSSSIQSYVAVVLYILYIIHALYDTYEL
jgi:hypothetical protein